MSTGSATTRRPLLLAMLISLGTGASPAGAADYSFFFTVSNDVSPTQPSATVTVWAAFDPKWYAFGQSRTEVWSSPDAGAFSDPRVLIQQDQYCDAGEVSPDGDSVLGVFFNQYHLLGGQFADTHNPLELWSATWTTDDFTPRDVPVWTQSESFFVYTDETGNWKSFYGPDFAEAEGIIIVVSGESCYADFTADGALDLFDFLGYVNAFNAGVSDADCNQDAVLDLFDFLCFTNAFNAGC